jgi:hypothetical protein
MVCFHRHFFLDEFNGSVFCLLGNAAAYPPPSTDLSSVPPAPPSLPSYQDSKPNSAWNDPPTVLMKASKPNPTKVLFFIYIILFNHSF